MTYIAATPEHYLHKRVGTGQCVAYVQAATNAPHTSEWRQGVHVLDAPDGAIARGTVIATFENGHYANHAHGNHAAIYLSHDAQGIQVIDQWVGQSVHYRTIHNHHGQGSASNDASLFYVVE